MIFFYAGNTYDQVADNNSGKEKWNARPVSNVHAVPHGLNPFSTQHSKHDHKRVHEVGEIPPRQITIRKSAYIVCEQKT